ncbi:MAG: hypothetical protein WCB46_08150 [Methanoregula sp.]
MTIRVHIDRLVLDGVPVQRHEGPAVQRSLEKELARLLAEGGLSADLASGGAYPDIPAADMNISGSSAREIGKGIARAVYGGIGR